MLLFRFFRLIKLPNLFPVVSKIVSIYVHIILSIPAQINDSISFAANC